MQPRGEMVGMPRRALGRVSLGLALPVAVLSTGARPGGWLDDADHDMVEAAHRLVRDRPALADGAEVVTFLGGAPWLLPFVTAVVVALVVLGQRHRAAFVAAAAASGAVANDVMKHLAGRDRPFFPDPVGTADGFSFPSGHAMAATICYGAIALVAAAWLTGRWRGVALAGAAVLVLAVGASRVLLGVHFPSDVVAGHLAGLGWLAGAVALWPGLAGRAAPVPGAT